VALLEEAEQGALRERMAGLRRAASYLGQQRDLALACHATHEQLALLELQILLDSKYGKILGPPLPDPLVAQVGAAAESAPPSSNNPSSSPSPSYASSASASAAEASPSFMDLSVSQTLHKLVALGARAKELQHEKAALEADIAKLQKIFKIPEKRFWHVKISALASSGQFEELRRFANSAKKSPVGYRPFAERVLEAGQDPAQVAYYIDRVVDLEERFDLYCRVGLWAQAAQVAGHKLKDAQKLRQVKALSLRSGDPQVARTVDQMLAAGNI